MRVKARLLIYVRERLLKKLVMRSYGYPIKNLPIDDKYSSIYLGMSGQIKSVGGML
mgnify:CR=1 FL=1